MSQSEGLGATFGPFTVRWKGAAMGVMVATNRANCEFDIRLHIGEVTPTMLEAQLNFAPTTEADPQEANIEEEAYSAGYAEGRADGHSAGYADGRSAARAEALGSIT